MEEERGKCFSSLRHILKRENMSIQDDEVGDEKSNEQP